MKMFLTCDLSCVCFANLSVNDVKKLSDGPLGTRVFQTVQNPLEPLHVFLLACLIRLPSENRELKTWLQKTHSFHFCSPINGGEWEDREKVFKRKVFDARQMLPGKMVD